MNDGHTEGLTTGGRFLFISTGDFEIRPFPFSFLTVLYILLSTFSTLNYTAFVKHQKCLTAYPLKIQEKKTEIHFCWS